MRLLKVLSVLSALTLIAACETAPTEGAAKSGTGAAPSTAGTGMAPGAGAMTLSSELAQVGDRVFFDFDKYNLKPQARGTVEKQAALLKKYPNAAVTVEGHCDERGTREYNLALGERRANAAKQYLVAQGIPAARISTISYGKERPDPVGSDEAAWARNRRAVTELQ